MEIGRPSIDSTIFAASSKSPFYVADRITRVKKVCSQRRSMARDLAFWRSWLNP
jgi:hypothetical protein